MKTNLYALVVTMSMLACAPPHQPQRWSTKGCSEAQMEKINVAVGWWNTESEKFFGVTSIEMTQDAPVRQLVCVTDEKDEEAIRMREIGFVGWARGDQILILDTHSRPLGDFLTNVIAHEFGHQLGLGHLQDETAVMYPTMQRSKALTGADISAFQSLDEPRD